MKKIMGLGAMLVAGLLVIPGNLWFARQVLAQSDTKTIDDRQREESRQKRLEEWQERDQEGRQQSAGQRRQDAIDRQRDANQRQKAAERRMREIDEEEK